MKKGLNFLTNPIFITAVIILLGIGGLVAAFAMTGNENINSAPYVERTWGNPESKVVITEYADFQCPACQGFYTNTEKQLKERYGDQIKFVYKHFPLSSIHASAQRAAEASEAAGAQGKFWEYHNKLFESQISDATAPNDQWTVEELVRYAKDLGLDTAKFESELKGNIYRKVVKDSQEEAQKKGYTGTPTVEVNGERFDNPTFETLEQKIKEILGEQDVAETTPGANPAGIEETLITPTPSVTQ